MGLGWGRVWFQEEGCAGLRGLRARCGKGSAELVAELVYLVCGGGLDRRITRFMGHWDDQEVFGTRTTLGERNIGPRGLVDKEMPFEPREIRAEPAWPEACGSRCPFGWGARRVQRSAWLEWLDAETGAVVATCSRIQEGRQPPAGTGQYRPCRGFSGLEAGWICEG